MTTPLIILISLAAAAFGVYCGWSAYLRRTSWPQDGALIWRFIFHLWVVVTCFVIAFAFTPESFRSWLVVPLMVAGLILIFRFRQQRRMVHGEESFLDPRHKDSSWIKKVR